MTDPSGKIYVVDDDAAVCESIEALLMSHGWETATFSSASEFLDRFDPSAAACILLDVRMPETDGLSLLGQISDRRLSVPVIMVTGYGDVPLAVRAMQAGAADFVEKPFEEARLLQSIDRAVRYSPPIAQQADAELQTRFASLTPRETEVMQQMLIGHPNKIIAHHLEMSPRTVEIHRSRVMRKTGADSLSHLVRMALRAGLDPDQE